MKAKALEQTSIIVSILCPVRIIFISKRNISIVFVKLDLSIHPIYIKIKLSVGIKSQINWQQQQQQKQGPSATELDLSL